MNLSSPQLGITFASRSAFGFVLTALAFLLVGCGGGGDKGPPKGYVLETIFNSSRPGYEIARLTDWTVEKGIPSEGNVFDLYSSPVKVGNFNPNVNIFCDKQGAKSGTDNYARVAVEELAGQRITAKQGEKVPIVGAQAALMTFTSDGFEFTQIYATDINCAWVLTLTTPQGERDKYMDTFLTMAKTFKRY